VRTAIFTLILIFPGTVDSGFCQESTESKPAVDYERLVTTEGDVYLDVTILDVEPDSLIVEHRNGAVRISLFDLPDEIRTDYAFDAELAMAHYKARDERLRSLRKKQVQERLHAEAAMAETARKNARDEDIRKHWIRTRARIIEFVPGGAMAYVDRIVMERKRSRTALGGEGLPGPATPSYHRMHSQPVMLKDLKRHRAGLRSGSTWVGYISRDPQDAALDHRPTDAPLVYRATVLSQ